MVFKWGSAVQVTRVLLYSMWIHKKNEEIDRESVKKNTKHCLLIIKLWWFRHSNCSRWPGLMETTCSPHECTNTLLLSLALDLQLFPNILNHSLHTPHILPPQLLSLTHCPDLPWPVPESPKVLGSLRPCRRRLILRRKTCSIFLLLSLQGGALQAC